MNVTSVFFALLWRTAVASFALMIALKIAQRLLSNFDIDLLLAGFATSENYIQLTRTLKYIAFSLVLIGTEFGARINIIKLIAGEELNFRPTFWRQYVVELSVLSTTLGILNFIVAETTTVDTWVKYQLFGSSVISLVGFFVIVCRLVRVERATVKNPTIEPCEDQ